MSDQKRVLIVDDEPDLCNLIKNALEKEGFGVDVAYDGVEGIEKVKDKAPDAIVLDVMMPNKDGYKMCAELKRDDLFVEIPIVMLTAVADHVSSTRYSHYDGMSMEADDYIAKGPDSTRQIVESIKGFLA